MYLPSPKHINICTTKELQNHIAFRLTLNMIQRILVLTFLSFSCCFAVAEKPLEVVSKTQRESRSFTFHYGMSVTDLSPGDDVRLWIPVPSSNQHQKVEVIAQDLPGKGNETKEPKYGNRMVYRSLRIANQGSIDAAMTYRVRRSEVQPAAVENKLEALSEHDEKVFLGSNTRVPIKNIPIEWKFAADKFTLAKQIYDRVDQHVRYDKSKPGYGNGDVLWVCDSRFGNCTDFHSLFISMARASNIPARFEIGFPLPSDKSSGDIGGYHCWASFYDAERGWFSVDISEADKHPDLKDYYFGHLSADRLRFTIGRDIDLVPQQKSPALNYFVYPHVEINGQVVDRERLELKFSFEDVPSASGTKESKREKP
jgi:hypothetical protein